MRVFSSFTQQLLSPDGHTVKLTFKIFYKMINTNLQTSQNISEALTI